MSSKFTPDLFGQLVREEIPEQDVPSLEARYRFVEKGRADSHRQWRFSHSWSWRFGLMGAAAVAALMVFVIAQPADDLTFQVIQQDGAGLHAQAVMEFSDGSSVQLLQEARARVERTEPNGAHLVLQRGKIHVSVVPNPLSRWTVSAGPIQVAVTGTQFDVDWDESGRVFVLELIRGEVLVTSPLRPTAVRMTAGQKLSIDLHTQSQSLSAGGQAAAVAPDVRLPEAASSTATEPALGLGEVTPQSSAQAASQSAGARVPAPTWKALLVQGNFELVLAEVRERGVERCLRGCELIDLEAAADAARYAGETGLAEQLLGGLNSRFPRTAAGQKATFLLGDVAQRQQDLAAAENWYRRYLSQSPQGSYAAEAVGRLLVMTRDPARQRELAERYLEFGQKGAYSDRARRVLAR
ncbi:MAG: hypothetical protein RJA70_3791 [Pseudomonadota bacterium]|jgi:TolA-binding protein